MRHFLFLIISILPFFINAQTTITNTYFPSVGSNLIMARATTATAYGVPASSLGGNNLTYDFRSWRPQTLDTQRFIAPDTEGSRLFPTAAMTFKPDSTKQIPFYRRTDSTFELIGLKGLFFQGLFIPVVVKPHTTLKERRAPLRLGASFQHSAGFQVTFPSSVAPDSLLRNSPFAVPDSIRITYEAQRWDTVDAWGTIRIPNGDFPILRERQRETIKTKVEILYAFLGWLDVTTLVLTGLSQPFYPERVFVKFWHATTQEPIAFIETDPQFAIRSVDYKAIGQRVAVPDFVDLSNTFSVYPNPSLSNITLDFEKTDALLGSLNVIDASGRLVFNQKINDAQSVNIAVNAWQNGTYFIYLMNKENRILGKQLFIKN